MVLARIPDLTTVRIAPSGKSDAELLFSYIGNFVMELETCFTFMSFGETRYLSIPIIWFLLCWSSTALKCAHLLKRGLYPVVAFLGEGGLEDGLEEFAGVVEVFLGLGGGRRDPLKGFIQDPHDPLLLGEGGDYYVTFLKL